MAWRTRVGLHTVEVREFDFIPRDLEVASGDKVQWRNVGEMVHTASRDDGPPFDTGDIRPGATSDPVEFSGEPQVRTYFCRPHRFMKARIVVRQ